MTTRPEATPYDTLKALLDRSNRHAAPIRRSFLQQGVQGNPKAGPLADLVHRHDKRTLDFYLLILAAASAKPFDVRHHSAVWARMLCLEEATGRVAVSKMLARLEKIYRLIERQRVSRLTRIILLREDGSGEPYTHPATSQPAEPYLQLPHEYWLKGWNRKLTLPGKAVLLIALSLRAGFLLPAEYAKEWYGISADTAQKGLRELRNHRLLDHQLKYKLAPLAPEGVTREWRYTLQPPFGHRRRRRSASSPTKPDEVAS